jgi:hypothetical protein
MQKIIFLLIYLALANIQAHAQNQNGFIVLLCDSCQINNSLHQINQAAKTKNLIFALGETVAPESNIYLLYPQDNNYTDEQILAFLRQQSSLKIAQQNHSVQLRNTTPNDPQFPLQWQYINSGTSGGVLNMDLDADLAWDITTGGLTALNDTIVVAVIDNGVNSQHPDLAANLWYNHAEIPNNGIDDDQNGYIDDYRGWNVLLQNDEIAINGGAHGTPVAGIIGAVGNNNRGVSGVNWAVKLMIIRSNFNTSEAAVIAAYNYALQARRRYNDSRGRAGAFVVATNSSWGLDYGRPADAPIWCAFYDTLGKYGILNAAATANLDIDVDLRGDLPTTCPSDYLICVTNLDRRGWKVQTAGYSQTSIDIGAFGEATYTINNAGSYGNFAGTSAAAPHVTGAIALAYAALCEDYIHLARVEPAAVAAFVRQSILRGARPSVHLDGITTTGGQLNLNGTLLQALSDCPSNRCMPPYNVEILSQTTSNFQFTWRSFSTAQNWGMSYKLSSDTIFSPPIAILSDTLNFENLPPCTHLDIIIWSLCAGGRVGDSRVGDSLRFSLNTDGCCLAPNFANAVIDNSSSSNNIANLNWLPVTAAQNYNIDYRPQNGVWQTINTNDTFARLTNLQDCAMYEYQIRSHCDSNRSSAPTNLATFFTPNCSDCSQRTYCTQSGQNSQNDNITRLQLPGQSISDTNTRGYIFIDTPQIQLIAGQTYPLTLQQGGTDLQYLRLWADWNQDGDFYDLGEQIAEDRFLFVPNLNLSINVPATALYGLTRLRIAIRYSAYPNLCETYAFGEVQEHCIFVQPATSITETAEIPNFGNALANNFEVNLQPQWARLRYIGANSTTANLSAQLEVFTLLGQQIEARTLQLSPNEEINIDLQHLPKAVYILRITTAKGAATWRF